MLRKIVCPIDFSTPSAHAMHAAARLAQASDAELLLVHVWYVPPSGPRDAPFTSALVQHMVEDDLRGLTAAAAELTAAGVRRVETVLQTGVPAERIIESARGADLIVMGSRGRTGLRRLLLGSVAERVVHHAPCPTLIIRGEPSAFHRILCAIDFSDSSRKALAFIPQLAAPDASITGMHVVEPPVSYSGQPKIADELAAIERRCAAMLDGWVSEVRGSSRSASARVEIGNPTARLLGVLDDEPGYDLVAVGHGRSGLSRFLLGSVAAKIVRHAPCSVLVARAPAVGTPLA